MRILDGLYYTFYRWLLKTSMRDIVEHAAYMFVTLLLCTTCVVFLKRIHIDIFILGPARTVGYVMGITLMIILYLFFVKSGRYKEIIERYSGETKKQKLLRNLIVITYIFLTFIVLLIK